jgi:4-amino-4-deoxy-L-arabinose transferase-like glycosyltransferase
MCCYYLQIRRRNDEEVGGLFLVGIMLGLPFYLKMEAIYFLEILIDFYLIAEDPGVEVGKNTSTVIPASRERRRKGNN